MAAILNFGLEGFGLFLIQFKPTRRFLQSFKLIGLLVQKQNIDFKNGSHGGHPRFTIGTIKIILAIFDLQVTLMLPTKFQVSWPFCSGEEAKNILSILQQIL